MTSSATPSRRHILRAAAAASASLSLGAFAQPGAPLRIVVPFAAGGGTDLIARLLADGMARSLGRTAIVDNKPGAGTIIGSDAVAKSPPDGNTLLMATFAHAVNPALQSRLPYDTDKAFAAVALVGTSPNVLVVRPDRPWRTVADVLNAARAAPGKLTYGSFGNGTSAHLAGALFAERAKVQLTHVPYKGSSPAITDLLGGQIDLMFTTAASVAQHVAAGKLRAVAVTSATRSAAWPDIPTIAESGVTGYQAESWYGLYAPAGTPAATIAQLHAAVQKAVQTDTFRHRVADEGLEPSAGGPEALERYVRAEQARWRTVIRDARITAE